MNTENDPSQIWETCLAKLKGQLPEPALKTWLAFLRPAGLWEDRFVLTAPHSMAREMVITRFEEAIKKTLLEITDMELSLEVTVQEPGPSLANTGPALLEPANELAGEGTTAQEGTADNMADGEGGAGYQLPSHEQYAVDNQRTAYPGAGLSSPRGRGRRTSGSSFEERLAAANLDARYTFEVFVTGGTNLLAAAAAHGVAEEPAKAYNPLFIYGNSGLGKTHLLQAIGYYICEHYPNLRVFYVQTETFLNEFVEAIRLKTQLEFKHRYRGFDVLLLDDVQVLGKTRETQEEFFYTINFLYDRHKQIVLSSDRHPRDIETLQDRLRSRFASGLITDVQPPELETRLAILRKKSEVLQVSVPDEVLHLIAEHVHSNIRELEGALNRLLAFASIVQVPLTLEVAETALADLIAANAPKPVPPLRILEATAAAFNFTVDELCSPSRSRPLVIARQVAMYLFRDLTDLSYPDIGRFLGGRDHTTIMHGHHKIAKLMKDKRQIFQMVMDIRAQLTDSVD